MKTDNFGTGFVGVRIDSVTREPIECPEHEHFFVCTECGQSVDRRDLGQVFHHEEPGHEKLALDS
jgi:Fe2+ or Zn2+ uptake regulation protein